MSLGPINVGELTVSKIQTWGNAAVTNSNSASFDLAPYIGILSVVTNANTAINSSFQTYLSSSATDNISNATNLSLITANFNAGDGPKPLYVDTRTAKRYLFANWLISGAVNAINVSFDVTAIGQKKYL